MNFLKVFSQPLLLAVVWFIGIRPATAIIEKLNPTHTIPPTVLGTIDIALISSGVAFLFSLWKPPVEITTKLINIQTRRMHSNIEKENASTTFKVWLEISIKVKHSHWINWSSLVQKVGGIFLCIKENLISHEIDSKYYTSMIKDIDNKPYIHIFDQLELSENTELEFVVHLKPDAKGLKTADIVSNAIPTNKNRIKRFFTLVFIGMIIKQKHEKHPVYIN